MTKELVQELYPNWRSIKWQNSPYEGVFISPLEEIPDFADPTPLKTVMAVKINPGKILPPHWHKRGKDWLEHIEIPNGNYTILGFAEETQKGESVIWNDHMEMFGVRNNSTDKPLYFISTMVPGYTGKEENRDMQEIW